MTLHLASFGGGVILAGSPDAQATTELSKCDAYDIGLRGQLVAASKPSDYLQLRDAADTGVWDHLYALGHAVFNQESRVIAVGNKGQQYQLAQFARSGQPSPLDVTQVYEVGPPHMLANPGLVVTIEQMPVWSGGSERVFVNLGAREGFFPNTAPGLYLLIWTGPPNVIMSIQQQFALGQAPPATKQLYFRGIVSYNNHLFGWGYDSLAANFNGPCRLMFSNPGLPEMWGNDNQGSLPARDFTDSDAIVLGDAGEIIRGACKWNGRLYVGTNQQLHFVGGYGRDSFLTDGSNPVAKSQSIVGPHAMIEGPDRHLYGVAEGTGLWVLGTQGAPEPIGRKLTDYNGRSRGYWDCIWTDPTQLTDYPGKTNRDLVWMVSDVVNEQVIIGIPWCNATAGYGYGTDTVVIKYHTRTGGFTRQIFLGVCYTAADWVRPENQQREGRYMGTATAGQLHVQRYAYQATQVDTPALPAALPDVEFGPFAIYGPDGVGALRRLYLTVAWDALPLAWTVTVDGDGTTIDSFAVTIGAVAPVAPAAGDVWLDTSLSDTNIGNGTAGAQVPARPIYIARTFIRGAWQSMGAGGGQGTRATIPLPVKRVKVERIKLRFLATTATGRWQLEGLGQTPGAGRHDA